MVTSLRQRHTGLKKFTVLRQLDFQQVRHIKNTLPLAEILADTFLFGKAVSHRCSSLVNFFKQREKAGSEKRYQPLPDIGMPAGIKVVI